MLNREKKDFIKSAYNGELFRQNAHRVVDMLADYLNKTGVEEANGMFVNKTPDEIAEIYKTDFADKYEGDYAQLLNELFCNVTPLHHPNYIGHQVATPLPNGALADMVMSLLNNSSSVFEMGRAGAGMEKTVTDWMCKKIGFDENSGGMLTSGGTLGNLTALLAARQDRAGYNIWENGVVDNNLCALVSAQSHYSVARAISVMGLGDKNAIRIPCDENFKMKVDDLKETYQRLTAEGKKVFVVVASACSTATGTFDDLEAIGKFCEENNIWFHVDAAHGGPTLLSEKYRKYVKGIEYANSVIWDIHKTMMMPAVATGVLFRNKKVSYSTFSQNASYILDRTFDTNWFDCGLRTMECIKPFMSLKIYSNLKFYGEKFFGDYVEVMYDLTKEFADLIEKSADFELATYPESNIICFRYMGGESDNRNELQEKIRNEILDEENFYIVKTMLNDKMYLRCTVINPLTEMKHLENLLNNIREIANKKIMAKAGV